MGDHTKTIVIALTPGLLILFAFSMSGLIDHGPALMLGIGFLAGGIWLRQELKQPRQLKIRATQNTHPSLDTHLLESIPIPVLLLDSQRKIKLANKAAKKEFDGIMESQDLGYAIRHPEVLSAVADTLSEGSETSFDVSLPGAIERSYLVNVVPVADPQGEIGNALLTLHDLTTVKAAENLRADFVANVSHELRTPLSSLVGFIETLQGEASQDPEAQGRFLAIMSAEAGRMSRLIEDLLSLSKIEVNEHVQPNDKVDLETIIESVVDALDKQSADKNISIVVRVPDQLSPIIGDADEVTQVFMNLIANALSYGKTGTAVTITAEDNIPLPKSPGKGVRVTVEDQGDGIAKDQLVRLTERFYRVDKARSRNLGGTGLGLAIVKHIINRHRGTLTVESTEGVGSKFSVLLPCKA